jgi:hypothetical protein
MDVFLMGVGVGVAVGAVAVLIANHFDAIRVARASTGLARLLRLP